MLLNILKRGKKSGFVFAYKEAVEGDRRYLEKNLGEEEQIGGKKCFQCTPFYTTLIFERCE